MEEKKLSPKQLEKRDRILNTAIKLFAQNGYSATTISDIAKEAEVSFGTVFTYFENKEALFEHAIREPLKNNIFFKREMTNQPILEQLESMVSEQITLMSHQRDYLHLIQQVLGQPAKFPELLEHLGHHFDGMMLTVIPFIEKGQEEGVLYQDDPKLVAASYISFIIGIRLTFADDGLSGVWDSLVPQALKLFGTIRNRG